MHGVLEDLLQKVEPFSFGVISRIGPGWVGAQSVGYAMQVVMAVEYFFVRNYTVNCTDIRIVECRVQAAFDFGVCTAADRNECTHRSNPPFVQLAVIITGAARLRSTAIAEPRFAGGPKFGPASLRLLGSPS